jgi:hypothetical protein
MNKQQLAPANAAATRGSQRSARLSQLLKQARPQFGAIDVGDENQIATVVIPADE